MILNKSQGRRESYRPDVGSIAVTIIFSMAVLLLILRLMLSSTMYILGVKNSWWDIHWLASTHQSQSNQAATYYFYRFLNRKSRQKANPCLTSGTQNQSSRLPKVSFNPSVSAESCLSVKQVTGTFASAGLYTDSMPFNSVRQSANQSQLPACCSPEISSGSWCSSAIQSVAKWRGTAENKAVIMTSNTISP